MDDTISMQDIRQVLEDIRLAGEAGRSIWVGLGPLTPVLIGTGGVALAARLDPDSPLYEMVVEGTLTGTAAWILMHADSLAAEAGAAAVLGISPFATEIGEALDGVAKKLDDRTGLISRIAIMKEHLADLKRALQKVDPHEILPSPI